MKGTESNTAERIDPLYLFSRFQEWEKYREPSAAWEILAAARSAHAETRAHARALLASSVHLAASNASVSPQPTHPNWYFPEDARLRVPHEAQIVDKCSECPTHHSESFCSFSEPVLQAIQDAGQRSTYPAGAILFVEDQMPRGIYFLCSGKVRFTTGSREGKILIVKTAQPGEALGLSAVISGERYPVTAETAIPSQVTFVERKRFLELLQVHSEVGSRAAQCLSRDFQAAYREIQELVLSRSSAGRLARLLLACSPGIPNSNEIRVRAPMTHEEMAQRIGSSRETVTRLLSELKRKRLIRHDGTTLVIRDRTALEAMAV